MRGVPKIFGPWGIRLCGVLISLAGLFFVGVELLALSAVVGILPLHAQAEKTVLETPPRPPPQEGNVIPRKVLVLDFVNQAKDTKSDYLSVSVAEALLDPLKKTGKFYLLPRASSTSPGINSGASGSTFDENAARERGRAVGADVVVIGNFVSVGDKVQIQTKAIDVHTGQIAVAKTASGKLDATVFDLIQSLANDMSTAMASALPPIPSQLVITQRVGFGLYAKDFRTHAFVGAGLPLGQPNPYLTLGLSALADLQFEFLHKYLNPYFSFAATAAGGQQSVSGMTIFSAVGGVAYTFTLPWKFRYIKSFAVTPFVAAGASFGTIRAAPDLQTQSYNYNVFTLSTGATLDAALSDRWSLALTLRGNYLAESQTPLPLIYVMLGAGYKI
ncbi:MAG: hypothetical protein JSR44_00330 [Spirochaetes bacterium]|nr:hypothetical protein [Spirochaetota bacterium]